MSLAAHRSIGQVAHFALAAILWVGLGITTSSAAEQRDWIVTAFGGQLTNNVWEEAINPSETKFIDSYVVGLGVARDFAQRGRFDFGWEIQAVGHFGDQDHFEFNTPVYARFNTPESWRILKSLTFGLGLSYATKVPSTEIERGRDSTRTLVYWMGEMEFHLPPENLDLVFRLHHRSDGYGLFPHDTGSNAFVLGLRWRH